MIDAYWQDGKSAIYNGDCLEVMSSIPDNSFDLVITSPPYNLGTQQGTGGGFAASGKKKGLWNGGTLGSGYPGHSDRLPYGEYVEWQKAVLAECWRVIKPTGAIYYNHKPRVQAGELQTPLALNPGLPLRQIVIWDRGNGMNFAPTHYVPMHEWILVFAGKDFRLKNKGASGWGDVWRAPPVRGNSHPAPFPLMIPERAIESTGAASVLDPFCGSGTTIRAAANAGISAVGIELSKEFCDMTIQSLAQSSINLGSLEGDAA